MTPVAAPAMSFAAGAFAAPAQASAASAAQKPAAGGCASCGSTGCPSCSSKSDKKVGAAAQASKNAETGAKKSGFGEQLSDAEQKQVSELKKRDREVRAHEQAHKAVGGQYAGSISYTYQKGPDGRSYAVGGEVPIDASPVAGDPQATIDKMRQVRAAALAPAEPSAQDRKVASIAQGREAEARADLAEVKEEERKAEQSGESDTPDPTAPAETADPNAPLSPETQAEADAATAPPREASDAAPLFAPAGVGNISSETLGALMQANEEVGRREAVSLSPGRDRLLEGVRAYQAAA